MTGPSRRESIRAIVTVRRTGGAAANTTVGYRTLDSTATAGVDYTATSGTLLFGLGVLSRSFSVPLLRDTAIEGDEVVLLALQDPSSGGTLGPLSAAALTITEDDRPGAFASRRRREPQRSLPGGGDHGHAHGRSRGAGLGSIRDRRRHRRGRPRLRRRHRRPRLRRGPGQRARAEPTYLDRMSKTWLSLFAGALAALGSGAGVADKMAARSKERGSGRTRGRSPRRGRPRGNVIKVGGSANPGIVSWFRERLDEGARGAGRDPKAEAIARREVAMYIPAVAGLEPVAPLTPAEIRELSLETLKRFAVFGTPEDVAAQLKELFDAGVDRFELGTPHGENEREAVRMLGEEVLPLLSL